MSKQRSRSIAQVRDCHDYYVAFRAMDAASDLLHVAYSRLADDEFVRLQHLIGELHSLNMTVWEEMEKMRDAEVGGEQV